MYGVSSRLRCLGIPPQRTRHASGFCGHRENVTPDGRMPLAQHCAMLDPAGRHCAVPRLWSFVASPTLHRDSRVAASTPADITASEPASTRRAQHGMRWHRGIAYLAPSARIRAGESRRCLSHMSPRPPCSVFRCSANRRTSTRTISPAGRRTGSGMSSCTPARDEREVVDTRRSGHDRTRRDCDRPDASAPSAVRSGGRRRGPLSGAGPDALRANSSEPSPPARPIAAAARSSRCCSRPSTRARSLRARASGVQSSYGRASSRPSCRWNSLSKASSTASTYSWTSVSVASPSRTATTSTSPRPPPDTVEATWSTRSGARIDFAASAMSFGRGTWPLPSR